MALYVTPSSCPASPAESFEKPLFTRQRMQAVEPRRLVRPPESRVARIKSRPPSGIMFAVFRAVKQFLTLLTLFSLEFYSSLKMPKNKVKTVHSEESPDSGKSFGSRKKVSFVSSAGDSGFVISRSVSGLLMVCAGGHVSGRAQLFT